MTKENEDKSGTKNSSIRDKLQEAYQKGLKIGIKKGRIEGMLTYQNRIIKNLEKDNEGISKMLDNVEEEIQKGY